jgi:hypothetical protein
MFGKHTLGSLCFAGLLALGAVACGAAPGETNEEMGGANATSTSKVESLESVKTESTEKATGATPEIIRPLPCLPPRIKCPGTNLCIDPTFADCPIHCPTGWHSCGDYCLPGREACY